MYNQNKFIINTLEKKIRVKRLSTIKWLLLFPTTFKFAPNNSIMKFNKIVKSKLFFCMKFPRNVKEKTNFRWTCFVLWIGGNLLGFWLISLIKLWLFIVHFLDFIVQSHEIQKYKSEESLSRIQMSNTLDHQIWNPRSKRHHENFWKTCVWAIT
jgi:hypothetical protein